MPRFDAVLFDLDGTLLDTIEDIHAAVNASLAECGYPLQTLENTRAFVGNGRRALVRRGLPAGTGEEELERVMAAHSRYYTAHSREHTAPYPQIPALLAALRERSVRAACVTNKSHDNAAPLVESFFPGLIAWTEGKRPGRAEKPAPEAAWAAMEALGVSPERTLFVGDSDVDAFTARNAGTACVLVSWGYRPRAELEGCNPLAVIDEPLELLKFI